MFMIRYFNYMSFLWAWDTTQNTMSFFSVQFSRWEKSVVDFPDCLQRWEITEEIAKQKFPQAF